MKNGIRPNINEMPGYVPGEQPQAGTFIKLNTNECPYLPSSRIADACMEVIQRGLNRYPDPMAGTFRKAASEVVGVPPEYIMAGNGSDDILTILTRTFVGENETLRLPYPSYILYKSLAQIQNAKSEEIPFDSDWNLTPNFSAPTPDLKLVYLPNPNSPSGTRLTRAQIAELADALPCPLVVDEAYADFADENCATLVLERKDIIVTRTMSKAYGLAGLRFGYVIAHPDLIQQFVKVKDSYNCDALSIAAASAAISDREWFTETTGKIRKTRDWMRPELEKLGFHTVQSHANFIWCTQAGWDLKSIYLQLKEQNIFVRYMVYDKWQDGGCGLRISIGTDEESRILLERLAAILGK
ncbi:MAG: histidinol-phosphate transaminase [Thermoguttaceae bacterium]|nr:histidinol-phosphate transaminase [Thermoguttaceae bacterium]